MHLLQFPLNIQATAFLLSQGFDIEGPFKKGLPYLSREDEAIATEREIARLDKNAIADIHLEPHETESIDFVRGTRVKIQKWFKLAVRGNLDHRVECLPSSLGTTEFSKYCPRRVRSHWSIASRL